MATLVNFGLITALFSVNVVGALFSVGVVAALLSFGVVAAIFSFGVVAGLLSVGVVASLFSVHSEQALQQPVAAGVVVPCVAAFHLGFPTLPVIVGWMQKQQLSPRT